MLNVRVVATGVTLIAASIAVAFAHEAKEPPPAATEKAADARPVRVILPAPWEPAAPAAAASVQSQK